MGKKKIPVGTTELSLHDTPDWINENDKMSDIIPRSPCIKTSDCVDEKQTIPDRAQHA